ncbi:MULTISPECIES: N-acetyltransferase [unclassified Mesorhizobium]|uniref:N-acetyltransferase n=1 Tax=unclassified Mesorhizobium TaxID=325217 RepID=UPI00398C7DE3
MRAVRPGYGSRLAHGVFEALQRDGKRAIAKCPFMSSYAAPHPEYGAFLDG